MGLEPRVGVADGLDEFVKNFMLVFCPQGSFNVFQAVAVCVIRIRDRAFLLLLFDVGVAHVVILLCGSALHSHVI